MTLEQRLKQLEQNEVELANRGWSLIQALRKAIEQRDYYTSYFSVVFEKNNAEIKQEDNKELLEILEGK